MFSWSGEPFVCWPLHSCVFLIFLWEDCSLGYQCWPLIVGIWALGANGMKTLLCFSCIPAGAQGTQLDGFPIGNSSRWYHCIEWCDFTLMHLSRCCSGTVLLAIALSDWVLMGGKVWGLFLCTPAQDIAHTCLQLLQPDELLFSHMPHQQRYITRHNIHSHSHINRRGK